MKEFDVMIKARFRHNDDRVDLHDVKMSFIERIGDALDEYLDLVQLEEVKITEIEKM